MNVAMKPSAQLINVVCLIYSYYLDFNLFNRSKTDMLYGRELGVVISLIINLISEINIYLYLL